MKAKRILLVTSSYPYGVGESFLTAELKCMSRYFESIDLAPSYYSAGQERKSYEGKVNVRYADARWGALRKWNELRDEKFNAEKNHDLFARELLILLESE